MKLYELTSRFSYLIQFGFKNDIKIERERERAIFVVCFEYYELFAQIYKILVNLLLNRIARFMWIFRVFRMFGNYVLLKSQRLYLYFIWIYRQLNAMHLTYFKSKQFHFLKYQQANIVAEVCRQYWLTIMTLDTEYLTPFTSSEENSLGLCASSLFTIQM